MASIPQLSHRTRKILTKPVYVGKVHSAPNRCIKVGLPRGVAKPVLVSLRQLRPAIQARPLPTRQQGGGACRQDATRFRLRRHRRIPPCLLLTAFQRTWYVPKASLDQTVHIPIKPLLSLYKICRPRLRFRNRRRLLSSKLRYKLRLRRLLHRCRC